MAIYYVDGTLGTDDGSHGTAAGAGAWKTLNYALGASGVPLTGGPHTVNVAAGTYSEGATGTGLAVMRAFGTLTTVVGSVSNPASCVIRNVTANTNLAASFGGCAHVRFEGFQFQANGLGGGTVLVTQNGVNSDLTFDHCNFVLPAVGNAIAYNNATAQVTDLRFTHCTINAATATTQTGVRVVGSGGYWPSGVEISNCTINTTGSAMILTNVTTATIERNQITSSGSSCVLFGTEGGAASVQGTATVADNVIIANGSAGTHGLLMTNGSQNCDVHNNRVFAHLSPFGYAVVEKGTDNHYHDNLLIGGATSGGHTIFFKGALRPNIERCTLLQISSNGTCIETDGSGLRTNSGIRVRDTTVHAAPGTRVFHFPAGSHDGTDDIRLLSYTGDLGTDLPANGYGSPAVSIGPALPTQHKWSVE